MGTNYYIRENVCAHCNRYDDSGTHIGRSSNGWMFCFNAREHTTFEAWRDCLKLYDGQIFDEYSRKISAAELLELIESKKDGLWHQTYLEKYPKHRSQWDIGSDEYIDGEGHRFLPREFC